MSATTIIVALLFAVWLVVAVAICIRGWRTACDGRSSEIEWEDGE